MFDSVENTIETLASADYIADIGLSTSLFLSMKMGKPLFLEGEPGVGKTEIAKVLSQVLDTELIRLQCYEGLDVSQAVYEWNYPRQLLEIQARGDELGTDGIFSEGQHGALYHLDPRSRMTPHLLCDFLGHQGWA